MERTDCGFCGQTKGDEVLVRGRRAFICRPCVGRALAASVEPQASDLELPEADTSCAFCDKPTPGSALWRGLAPQTAICASCLGRSYAFLAQTRGLEKRRERWKDLGEQTPAALVLQHFGESTEIVTSSRTFPEYLRVDLHKALSALLSRPGHRCLGLHQQYGHDTLTFVVLQKNERVFVSPLQFDEIDIGEDLPARCLRNGLWLLGDPLPHAVLLSSQTSYGRSAGWHLEIVVPTGEAGLALARSYFQSLEESLARSVSYRGKVLSLEKEEHARGIGAAVMVHRLAPVRREDIVLPEKTLALLERNVFSFARHRDGLRAMGLSLKKGLLFYGPPGTGKTHTVRYLAGALPGHTTLLVTAEQVGLIGEYMTLARLLSPSIVVIEDADLIARQRESMESTCEEVLLNKLLNEMDGLKENAEVLFVLTTNRPEALEVALTARPGRIDQAIEFPLPDADGRRKLARLYGRGVQLSEETLERVVERTERCSAAFIKELMRRSAQFALERDQGATLTAADVDAALDELLFAGGRLNAALLGALGGLATDA